MDQQQSQTVQSKKEKDNALNFMLCGDPDKDKKRNQLIALIDAYEANCKKSNQTLPGYINFFKYMLINNINKLQASDKLSRPFDRSITVESLKTDRNRMIKESSDEFLSALKTQGIALDKFEYTDDILQKVINILGNLSVVQKLQKEFEDFFEYVDTQPDSPIDEELKKSIIFRLKAGILSNIGHYINAEKHNVLFGNYISKNCLSILKDNASIKEHKENILGKLKEKYNKKINDSSYTEENHINAIIKIFDEEILSDNDFLLLEKENQKTFINDFIDLVEEKFPKNKKISASINLFSQKYYSGELKYQAKLKLMGDNLQFIKKQTQAQISILKGFYEGIKDKTKAFGRSTHRAEYVQNFLKQIDENDPNGFIELLFISHTDDKECQYTPVYSLYHSNEEIPDYVRIALKEMHTMSKKALSDSLNMDVNSQEFKGYLADLKKDYLISPPKYKTHKSTYVKGFLGLRKSGAISVPEKKNTVDLDVKNTTTTTNNTVTTTITGISASIGFHGNKQKPGQEPEVLREKEKNDNSQDDSSNTNSL